MLLTIHSESTFELESSRHHAFLSEHDEGEREHAKNKQCQSKTNITTDNVKNQQY